MSGVGGVGHADVREYPAQTRGVISHKLVAAMTGVAWGVVGHADVREDLHKHWESSVISLLQP